MSVHSLDRYRIARAMRDPDAVAHRDAIDVGDWLRDRAVPEPEKSGFRFIVIGALAALSWLAVYAIWSVL